MVLDVEFSLDCVEKKPHKTNKQTKKTLKQTSRQDCLTEKMPSQKYCFSHWNKTVTFYIGKEEFLCDCIGLSEIWNPVIDKLLIFANMPQRNKDWWHLQASFCVYHVTSVELCYHLFLAKSQANWLCFHFCLLAGQQNLFLQIYWYFGAFTELHGVASTFFMWVHQWLLSHGDSCHH